MDFADPLPFKTPAALFSSRGSRAPSAVFFCQFWRIILVLLAFLCPSATWAFPPAPYYTIYGDVRDQYGILLPAGGASVVLFQASKEILREPLTAQTGADFNYQIRMRIDMLRTATTSYSSLALSPGSIYTLAVDIAGQLFYPIEMKRPPVAGNPADRVRLDLTLGVDSDGDGLPDAWEEAQLYEGGYAAGPNGWDLSLIDRNGDFDHDGISNLAEYIAGTYAADATATLKLHVKEKLPNSVRLEFYAIYGKVYTLESSSDVQTWSPLSFSTAPPKPAQASLDSITTGVTSIYVESSAGTTFYRLNVR